MLILDIADVTNFVLPGTPLDEEASKRGTSVYLVEQRIDMLPKPLTEGMLHTYKATINISFDYRCELSVYMILLLHQIFARFAQMLSDWPSQ